MVRARPAQSSFASFGVLASAAASIVGCGRATSIPPADGCFPDKGSWGVPLLKQKAVAASFWKYDWGPPPYGSAADKTGVLQVVNGGSEPMWIRYAGNGIMDGAPFDWAPFITKPSALNGDVAHAWNKLDDHGMVGQGDGFKLNPGEYQILPFAGSAAWVGGTLGCGPYGNNCTFSPEGRGAGTGAGPTEQPNTLFEWTAPGVWDSSLVDGFSLPMKVEVDGCGAPGTGSREDCQDSYPLVHLALQQQFCPNQIIENGRYYGCKSMCGCQNAAQQAGKDIDPTCPNMQARSVIGGKPHAPGGYCGCPQGDCVEWLRDLFHNDTAGVGYCDAIKKMAHDPTGKRSVYCQAYDDLAGTRSYGNGVMKVTFCNLGFEMTTTAEAGEAVPQQLGGPVVV